MALHSFTTGAFQDKSKLLNLGKSRMSKMYLPINTKQCKVYMLWIALLASAGSCAPSNHQPEGIKAKETTILTASTKRDTSLRFTSTIRSILEDSKGNYWFGSDKEGVCRYDGESFTYFTTENGLGHNQVRTIQEDVNGHIWFAIGGGIVSYWDGKKMTVRDTRDKVLNRDITTTVWEVQATDLFFNREIKTQGGKDKGIYRFDGQTFSALLFPLNVNTKEVFDHNGTVTSVAKGVDGALWVASYGGVIGYDGQTFEIINDPALKYHVRKILTDSKGNLWIGNNGIGVLRYDGKTTTKLTDLKAFNFSPYDRVPNHVFALEEDKFGNIWIGDRDTGAWRFDGNTLDNYTSKDGLFSNFVRVIYKDKKGELWFGQSNGGVSKFNGISFDQVFK